MIRPADRTQLVQEYYFSKKLKEIEELNQSEPKVINLGIGNPDMFPPEFAIEELVKQAKTNGTQGYQSYKGIPELRNAFSSWYEKFYGVELNANTEILPLMGSKEGIMHISMAYLNPGDKVLVPNPGYPTYMSVSKIVGADILSYDLKEENNWLPDFEALDTMDLSGVKLMWVNYPNMPTGQPGTMEVYEKLIAFGLKHNILICNDNPYSFILNDKPISILQVEGAKEIAFELNSLSKSHNMAGFRVGMVAGKEEYIGEVLKIKSNMDSGMYKPLQLAAAKALAADKSWYDSINEQYKIRRKLVWELFDLVGATYDKNQTGLFVWARIPDTMENAFDFSDKYLYANKVFLTPGTIFGTNGTKFARISLCSNEDLLKEAIDRIKNNK